jgi:hypothetical protein
LSQHLKSATHAISIWFGTVMMLMGVGMNVFPRGTMFVWSVNSIQGETRFTQPSTAAIVTSIILAVVGLAMAIYLISV